MPPPLAAEEQWSMPELAGYFAMIEALNTEITEDINEIKATFAAYYQLQPAGSQKRLNRTEIKNKLRGILNLRPDLYDAAEALCIFLGTHMPSD